jgi:outer membrane protein OmpA-like peptidoglycan-associated protein
MADEQHKNEGHAEGDHGSHGGSSHGHGGGHGGGGHAEGEHEGAPEWLISFADNVMLIMAFFVIMLAMNMGPKGGGSEGEGTGGKPSPDMIDFVIAVREGFNNPISVYSDRPEDQPFIRRIIERKGGEGRNDGVPGRFPEQQAIRPSGYNRPTATISFDDRSTVIGPDARATLAAAAERLKDQRWVIEVRGHVSPFESMRNPRVAMELSHERAMAAAAALVEAGLTWENLRIVAMGDNDRIVPRTFDRAEDRSNQRVELVVTNETIRTNEAQGAAPPAGAAPGSASPGPSRPGGAPTPGGGDEQPG